ncbi:MAG: hypothetical protein AB8H86_24025 [Polyangiales bacterium]
MNQPTQCLLLVLCLACAGNQATVERAGESAAPPSMECLPSAAHESDFTEHMRFAWLLTEQSFEVQAPPAPPSSARTVELQDWTDVTLQPWLAQKTRLVEAARAELNVAAEEAHPQRTIAGALVALMYEDVARVLRRVPVPDELRSEPEIATVFREVIDAQARPYLDHARRAYRACALNSRGHSDLRNWMRFCQDRGAELPTSSAQLQSGETSVEVIAPE